MEGRCPECSRAYDISDEFLAMGGRAKCPHCLLELEFPEQVGAKAPVDQFQELTKPDPNRRLPASRQEPEELDSHCSSCGRHFKVDKEYLAMGGSAQCPHCAIDLVFDDSVPESAAEPEADYPQDDGAGAQEGGEGDWTAEDGDESYDSVLDEGDTFVVSQPEESGESEESDPWAVETELNLPELDQVGGPLQAESEPAVADSQEQWPESEEEAVAEDSEPTEAYDTAGFSNDLRTQDQAQDEDFTTDLQASIADSLDQEMAPEPSGEDLPVVLGVPEPSDPWESPDEESAGVEEGQLPFGEESQEDEQDLDQAPTALQGAVETGLDSEPAPFSEDPFGRPEPAEEPVDLTAAFAESESDASAEPFPGEDSLGDQVEEEWSDDSGQEPEESGTPGDLEGSAGSDLAAGQAGGDPAPELGDDGLFTGLASTEDWASAAAKWAESGFQANEMPSFIQGPEPEPEPEPEPLTPGDDEQPITGPATEPDAGGQVILGRMTEDAVEVSDADILMLDDSEVESIEGEQPKPSESPTEQETWARRASREVDKKTTEKKAKATPREPSRFARLKSPPILAGLVGLIMLVIVGILWVVLGGQEDIDSVNFPTNGLVANVVEAPAPPEYEPKQDAMEHYGLGNRLAHDGKFEDAILEYKQASRLDPGYPHPHRALGSMYAALGKRKLSRSSYEDYLRLAPHAPDHVQVREIIKTTRGN